MMISVASQLRRFKTYPWGLIPGDAGARDIASEVLIRNDSIALGAGL